MTRPTRRGVLGATAAALVTGALPTGDRAAEIILDDASGLNPTPVARHIVVTPDREAEIVARLRTELSLAAAENRPVALGVARHSMGGQSLVRHGSAFTFTNAICEIDSAHDLYRASAGTRWRDVIAALDPIGFSPAIMQSNSDFGAASSFSVNAHGWAVPRPPVGSSVRALRLMLADGSIVSCSRQENPALFGHVMGGYGLFGIVLDLELEMNPNLALRPWFDLLAPADFAQRFLAICADPAVEMAYGRLDVSRASFLQRALTVAYHRESVEAVPPVRASNAAAVIERAIYRAEVGSELAKSLRWFVETKIQPRIDAGVTTRNTVLSEPVSVLAEHDPRRTDILHEYFLGPANLAAFLDGCRTIILASRQELLNITLRFVAADRESALAYARTDCIGAVMSFSQQKTAEAEADMQAMTRTLIDCVLGLGGSFYLPYRLHATRCQIAASYPALEDFIALKRRYDPHCLFRNALWDRLI